MNRYSKFLILGLIMLVGCELAVIHTANSATSGTIRVPLSWCPVDGSQAVTYPHIPDPWGGIDTTTDDVLWRRHERVTDNIYHPAGTGITFRSGILDALHTSLNFPIVSDPQPMLGTLGNATAADPYRVEINAMIHNCNDAWTSMTTTGVVNGISTINIRRFVDTDGSLDEDLIGKGACIKSAPGTSCNEPWNGYVFVIDNCYTAVGGTCGGSGWNNDPYDQNLAHELGHALGLNHRDATGALMASEQQETGPGGTVNNIGLNTAEVTALRNNAMLVRGSEIDPENSIVQGQIVQSIKVDKVKENSELPSFQDISSYKVTLDKKQNNVYLDEELFGLIPEKIKQYNQTQYWTLINLDNDTKTGGNKTILQNIGVPPTKFLGVDLVLLAQLNATGIGNGTNFGGKGWFINADDAKIAPLNSSLVKTKLKTMFIESHYRDITNKSRISDVPIFNTISTTLSNPNLIKLNKPLSIQSIVYTNGKIVDRLDNELETKFPTLELVQPLYPQCFGENSAQAGKNTTVSISGLLPDNSIHLLIGPRMVANGTTDNLGNSTIEFEIPKDVRSGLHLITVGVDETAFTADCEINVNQQPQIQTS